MYWSGRTPHYTLFESTYDGLVLGKQHFSDVKVGRHSWKKHWVLEKTGQTQFFHSISGHYLASYEDNNADNNTAYLNYCSYWSSINGSCQMGFTADSEGWQRNFYPLGAIIADTAQPFTGVASSASASYPPSQTREVVARPGESFYDISRNVFNTRREAQPIAGINGYSVDQLPTPGDSIRVPQYLPTQKTANSIYPTANQALSAQLGSALYPHFITPQPPPPPPPPKPHHGGFLDKVVHVVVDVVAVAIGFAVAGPAGAALGATITGALVAATAATLADMAGQLLMDAAHLQDGIDWREALGDGLSAAFLTMGAGGAVSAWEEALDAGEQNAVEQGINILDHGQHGFDLTSFTASIVEGGIDAKVDPELKAWKLPHSVDDPLNAAMNTFLSEGMETHGHRFSLEDIAEQVLGTAIGDGINGQLDPEATKISKDLGIYDESSQARQRRTEPAPAKESAAHPCLCQPDPGKKS